MDLSEKYIEKRLLRMFLIEDEVLMTLIKISVRDL